MESASDSTLYGFLMKSEGQPSLPSKNKLKILYLVIDVQDFFNMEIKILYLIEYNVLKTKQKKKLTKKLFRL